MTEENPRRYCMLLMPGESEGKPKAALLNQFKWQPGTDVSVRFVEGDPGLQERVARVAQE